MRSGVIFKVFILFLKKKMQRIFILSGKKIENTCSSLSNLESTCKQELMPLGGYMDPYFVCHLGKFIRVSTTCEQNLFTNL